MVYDVAIVGAGVVGSLIARELSKYNIKTVLLEKFNDVAQGTTKANSAIVHAGYDAVPGTLKAKLNVEGSHLMSAVCDDLSVPFKKIGSLVVAFTEKDMNTLESLLERGKANHVPQLEIVGRERLHEMEPNINEEAYGALYAPTAGIVCPYELCIAAAENAVANGVEFVRNFAVESIDFADGEFTLNAASGSVKAKYVINAAGVFSDTLAGMIGDNSFTITARRGEYLLLDKSMAGVVSRTIFQCPSEMGKGVLITPTVDNNVLIGPSAEDIDEKDDVATTPEGIGLVQKQIGLSVPKFAIRNIITSFSGVRAHGSTDDFIIAPSEVNGSFINVAGIESPGLSAAPAIAKYVEKIVLSLIGEQEIKADFNPLREKPVRFREMSVAERKELIAKNSAYGRVVCRCETVTEGEIIDAIKAPAGARDVDGVKRRTRSGMGRCQGGFCGSKVVAILSRELGLPLEEVSKFGGDSTMLIGRTK